MMSITCTSVLNPSVLNSLLSKSIKIHLLLPPQDTIIPLVSLSLASGKDSVMILQNPTTSKIQICAMITALLVLSTPMEPIKSIVMIAITLSLGVNYVLLMAQLVLIPMETMSLLNLITRL